MITNVLPVTVGLALRAGARFKAEHAWRRTALILAGSVAALLSVLTVSAVELFSAEDARESARTPYIADSKAEAKLYIAPRADVWNGAQFPVLWIEPAEGSGDVPIPPGMKTMPAPGEAVISPELHRLAAANSTIAARYPVSSAVLSSEGLKVPTELFAYVRPPVARSIANDQRSHGIRGFGAPLGVPGSLTIDAPNARPTLPMLLAGIALLAIPMLLLSLAAVSTVAPERDRRMQILSWMGWSRRRAVSLNAIEAMVVSTPGILLVVIGWYLLAPHLTRLPPIGRAANPGDLSLSPVSALLCAAFTLTFVALSAIATSARTKSDRPRPGGIQTAFSVMRAVPALLGTGTILLGLVVSGKTGGALVLAGVVTFLLGLPVVLPFGVRSLGRQIQRLPSVVMLFAGRTLERNAIRSARPMMGLVALAILLTTGAGFLAVVGTLDPPPVGDQRLVAARVSSLAYQPQDLVNLRGKLPGSVVAPYTITGSPEGPELRLGATCADLAVLQIECSPDKGLVGSAADGIARAVGFPPGILTIVLGKVANHSNGQLLALSGPRETFAQDVRAAAGATLVGPVVMTLDDQAQVESPLVPWLIMGFLVGAVLLLLAACILLVDGVLRAESERQLLAKLGVPNRKLMQIEALQLLSSYTFTAGIGLAVGTVLCIVVVLVGGDTAIPFAQLGRIWLAILLIGLLASCLGVIFRQLLSAKEAM